MFKGVVSALSYFPPFSCQMTKSVSRRRVLVMNRYHHRRELMQPVGRRDPIMLYTFWIHFSACCLVVLISACAHSPVKSPMDDLRATVEKTWQAKESGDCLTVYKSMPSNYRKMVSKEAFAGKCFKMQIRNHDIVDLKMANDGDNAVATVKFDVFQMGYWIPGAQIKEHWVKESRRWVMSPPKGKAPPF